MRSYCPFWAFNGWKCSGRWSHLYGVLFFLNPYLCGTGLSCIQHQNSNSLRLQFGISWEAARHIIKTCPTCLQFLFFPLMESILGVCSPTICGKWMLHIFLILENWNMCLLLLMPSLVLSWPHFNLERLVNIVFSIAYGVFLLLAYLNASKQTMALDMLAAIFKPSVPSCTSYTRLESHIIHRAKELLSEHIKPFSTNWKNKKGEFVC